MIWRRLPAKATIGIAAAVGLSAAFKLVAFIRETYVASMFGLSSQTDAYFGFQQLPLTLATFMFGAFSLAFAPAYAEARRNRENASWLAAVLVYAIAVGFVLTLATALAGPILAGLLGQTARSDAAQVILILSIAYVPIIIIGLWAAACIGSGRNVAALTATGAPYLVMAVAIVGLCQWRGTDIFNLPWSLTAGFGLVGLASLVLLLRTGIPRPSWTLLLGPWRDARLQVFGRQLASSSVENVGFAANQLLAIWFLGQTVTGAVTANSYAMRIGMLAFNLFTIPLAQIAQARICTAESHERQRTLRRYLAIVFLAAGGLVLLVIPLRLPILSAVYLRGRFSLQDLGLVASILPAWSIYVLVMSMNAVLARYQFAVHEGASYARRMWAAYAFNNLLRLWGRGWAGPAWVVWAAVIGEGMAFGTGLWLCLRLKPGTGTMSASAISQHASA